MAKVVIGIVIAVVVVGGGVWYFMGSDNNDNGVPENGENTETNNTNAQNTAMSGNMSLRQAMQEYEEQQCTYEDENGSGIVYVGHGAMRGDFISTGTGGTINSHMIVDGDSVYVWTDGESEGFKMSLSAMQEVEGDSSVDLDKEQDFECNNWNVDNNKFNLPASITFTDYSELMTEIQDQNQINMPQAGQNPQDDLLQQQCAVCAGLPDEAQQAQCLVSLGCPQ